MRDKSLFSPAVLTWRGHAPYSSAFGDIYYDQDGAAESHYVFIEGNHLDTRFKSAEGQFVIAETGFGTGLNFLNALRCWRLHQPQHSAARLVFYSFECFPLRLDDLRRSLKAWPELAEEAAALLACYPKLTPGWHVLELPAYQACLVLVFDDVLSGLADMRERVSAWFLDGFDPKKNPQMWSTQLFKEISRLSDAETTLATFTVAGQVRRGLEALGWSLSKRKGFGRKREMLIASFPQSAKMQSRTPWFELSPAPAIDDDKRLIIVGAGIAGVATALKFLREGWRVTLIDQSDKALSAASGNPSALVMPKLPSDQAIEGRFYRQAFNYTVGYLNQLKLENEALAWHPQGVLHLIDEPVFSKLSRISGLDESWRLLTPQDVSKYIAVEGNKYGLLIPDGGWLEPQSLLALLLNDDKLKCIFNCAVGSINRCEDEWHVYNKEGDKVTAGQNLVLANAMSVMDIKGFESLQLKAIRGQVSYFMQQKCNNPLPDLPIVDRGYVAPNSQGYHVIGASYNHRYLDLTLRAQDHISNIESVSNVLGTMENMPEMAGRAGIRAVTTDHLPIAGPAFDQAFFDQAYGDLALGKRPNRYPQARYVDGLYVNVGHGSRGFISAWLVAEYLYNLLAQNTQVLPCALERAIHPARFLIRQYKRIRNRKSG